MDPKAYTSMNYALCLLSAAADGKRHGCIINSFHQVTSSYPPKFTIAVNKDHETCKAVQAAGSFCVTLLAADAPSSLVEQFGYKSGRVGDKFASYDCKTDGAGSPYLTEHMVFQVNPLAETVPAVAETETIPETTGETITETTAETTDFIADSEFDEVEADAGFPLWIPVVAVLLLVGGGAAAWFLYFRKQIKK